MTNTETREIPVHLPCLCGMIVCDTLSEAPNTPYVCEECGEEWSAAQVAEWEEIVGDFDGEIVWEKEPTMSVEMTISTFVCESDDWPEEVFEYFEVNGKVVIDDIVRREDDPYDWDYYLDVRCLWPVI